MEEWVVAATLAAAVAGVAGLEGMLRRVVLRRGRRQMLADAGAALAPPVAVAADVPAAGLPRLVRRRAGAVPPEAYLAHARWRLDAIEERRAQFVSDLRCAGLYVALPAVAALVTRDQREEGVWFPGLLIGGLTAALALGRHALALYRIDELNALEPTPDDPWWKRALFWVVFALLLLPVLAAGLALIVAGVGLVPIWWISRRFFAAFTEALITQLQVLLTGLLVAAAGLAGLGMVATSTERPASFVAGVAFTATALWHGWTLLARTRSLRRVRGSALLVLRVFGQQRATEFTFNRLIRLWRYFGRHFTVVDGTLVQAGGTNRLGWVARLALLPVLVFGGLASWALAASRQSIDGMLPLFTAAMVLPVGALMIALAHWRVDRRFIRDRAQLLTRLRRLDERPRNLDLSYRHERALCHNDTWFMAVGEFARRADLVLMDLRGLQARNLGCRQEIEFLFDSVPAARIVFLVDDCDAEALDAQLADCWRLQTAHSPNVHERAAELTLFVARSDTFESVDLMSLVPLIVWKVQQAAAL